MRREETCAYKYADNVLWRARRLSAFYELKWENWYVMFLSTKIILNDIYNENNYCRMNEVNKNKNKQSILFFSILVLGGYLLAIWSIVILPLQSVRSVWWKLLFQWYKPVCEIGNLFRVLSARRRRETACKCATDFNDNVTNDIISLSI